MAAAAAPDPKPRLNVPPSMAAALRLDPLGASPSPSRRLAEAPKTPSPSKTTYSDRFIPCRSSSRLHNFELLDSPSSKDDTTAYSRLLRAELFDSSPQPQSASPNTNLFRFKKDTAAATSPSLPPHHHYCAPADNTASPRKPPRKVPKTPHKVLDAPSLQDDFYLNLVDWSSQNMLAVGLGTCVYLWSASNSKVTKLCDLGPRDTVCAVHWSREGSYLAIGTGLGDVQIWDSSRCKRIRNMGGHQTRTGVLAWSSCILSSGSRDKDILQHDIRVPGDYISKFSGHRSEVCNLAWCKNVNELVATLTGHTMRVLYLASSPDGQTPVRDIGLWSFPRSHIR
nr:unnamed protein product [Digitaria exilis]